MSCFSRLLGLVCAIVPGLFFLYVAIQCFTLWPELGYLTGPLYSLLSLITAAVCLYLGFIVLFGRDRAEEPVGAAPPNVNAPVIATPIMEAKPLQAAPLPVEIIEPMPAPIEAATPPVPVIISTEKTPAPVSVPDDSPETRIRQLARTRPQWQVTAPQLAHMANINMAVADVTAREMAENGQAQIQTGPNGETIYLFDLTD